MENETTSANYVPSTNIRITLNAILPSGDPNRIKYLIEYLDANGIYKPLPPVGEPHPAKEGNITAETGTTAAHQFGKMKWHHHSDCITIEIGGAEYQICWP